MWNTDMVHLLLYRSLMPASLTCTCITHLCLHRSLMPASLICACIAHHVVSEKYIFKWISIKLALVCIFAKNRHIYKFSWKTWNIYVKQLFTKYLLFLGTVCPTLKDGSAARHSFERRQLKKYPPINQYCVEFFINIFLYYLHLFQSYHMDGTEL
jgi:hypothetical protein